MSPVPAALLPAFGLDPTVPLVPVHGGLINETWRVGAPPSAVLQRVNPIFPPQTLRRLDEVTRHLAAAGRRTPLLLRTRDGELGYTAEDGGSWRLLSWVEGSTIERVGKPAQAWEAARLIADFHRCLEDFPGDLTPLRPDAHHTPKHMAHLEAALSPPHRLHDEVLPIGEEILAGWSRWERRFSGLAWPEGPAHGDLKISNVRFDAPGERAICLLDLDTLGRLPLGLELGDALRSWCNPAGEGAAATLDEPTFAAAIAGYRAVAPAAGLETVVPGLWRICLELSARFAADAIFECYFGWDPRLGRGEHNLLRARGQLDLARLVEARLAALQSLVG